VAMEEEASGGAQEATTREASSRGEAWLCELGAESSSTTWRMASMRAWDPLGEDLLLAE
jgi:hypothetical protein